jgi:ATP phosphoribosyltransferase regulatory subunit HisZ
MPVVTRARRAFERRSVVIDVEELVPSCSVNNNLRSRAVATPSYVVPVLDVEEAAHHLRATPESSRAIMLIQQVAPALERRIGTGSVVMDVEEAPPPFYRLRAVVEVTPAMRLPPAQ